MKIILFGAGHVGVALAETFSKSDHVKRIMVCDRRGIALEELSNRINSNKVKTFRVSIEQESLLLSAMKSYDVLISALPQRFSPKLTNLAIRAGLHYIDLGSKESVLEQQHEMHDAALKNKLWLIPHCGFSPGLTNIVAMHAMKSFDSVEDLVIRSGCLPVEPIPPFNYQLVIAADALLSEYFEDQWGIEKGKRASRRSLEGLQSVDFGAHQTKLPLEAFYTGNRINTLSELLENKVQRLSYQAIRYQGHRNIIEAFRSLQFDQKSIFDVRSQMTYRRLLSQQLEKHLEHHKADFTLMQIEIKGIKDGSDHKQRIELAYEKRGDGDISSLLEITAISTYIITKLAFNMKSEHSGGFHSPEEFIDGDAFINALKELDVKLHYS